MNPDAGSRTSTSRFELEEALAEGGCVVCRLVDRTGGSYLGGILYESVNDPGFQREFRGSLGFCNRHAHRMIGAGDGLGAAILYRAAVRELLRVLSEVPDRPRPPPPLAALFRSDPKSKPAFPEPGDGCPVCRVEGRAEERYLKVLVEGASDGYLDAAVKAGPGFVCARHLSRASRLYDGWLPHPLVEATREAVRDLDADLGLYVRHRDYRFAGEPWGTERDAWIRAVGRMVGPART